MGQGLRDAEIREAAHRRLLAVAHADPETLVVDELGLNHGGSRVDVAVVNGHLHGFEIKSDVDNLARLRSQIVHYGAIMDCATLIATRTQAAKAMPELPDWWGLIVASSAEDGIRFETVRECATNPAPDPVAVARLLWRAEAVDLLGSLGAEPSILRKPRRFLYEALAERMSAQELGHAVRSTLKARKAWRGRASRG
jgi:hypothetical protein